MEKHVSWWCSFYNTPKPGANANQIFRTFTCKTLADYHDFLLTTDTLLLACVSENFRKVCYETYCLDCIKYFSAANLAGDAYLKTCNINVRLLEERERERDSFLRWRKNPIRGGMSSVYSSRHFKANNKYLQDFDKKKLRVLSVSQSMRIIDMGA